MVGGHRAVGLRHVNMPIGDHVGAVGEFDQAPLAKLRQNNFSPSFLTLSCQRGGFSSLCGLRLQVLQICGERRLKFNGVPSLGSMLPPATLPATINASLRAFWTSISGQVPSARKVVERSPLMRRRWKKSHVERWTPTRMRKPGTTLSG